MKLTDKQIEELFQFTRKHFVEWYDLQAELVDHLANDIEQIWKEKPNLSFNEAKIIAFKKFGVFGFMDVISSRQSALEKRYRKLIAKEFIKYFKLPKIILTVFLIFVMIYFLRITEHNHFAILSLGLGVFIFPVFAMFKTGKRIKKRQQETGRKWLFEESIKNLGGVFIMIYFPFQISLQVLPKITNWTLQYELIVASYLVLTSIIYYVAIVIIPPKAREIIAKEHPEYEMIS